MRICFFLTVLGLCCCAQAFSSCGVQASHYRGFSHSSADFSSWGTGTELLRSMWNLPRPGTEPISPTLAGGFLTTGTPGKSYFIFFCWWGSWEWYHTHWWLLSLIRHSLFFQKKLLLCFRTWLAQTSLLWLAFPRSEVEQENSTLPMARRTWVFLNKNH